MFGRKKVKKVAHPDLVLMLLTIRREHEYREDFPDLVDETVERTFDLDQQWDRVAVTLTDGQEVVGLIKDNKLTMTVDDREATPHEHHLFLKPEDVLGPIYEMI